MRERLRRLQNWRRLAPRYTEDADALERLFRVREDPWHFLSDPYEEARLTFLQQLVLRVPHRSILEVGCAEGLLTAWLTTVAERVVAVDVSATACARTRARAMRATVVVANMGSFEPGEQFDLVICSEALYYMRDPAAALTRLRQMGACVLLTYTRRERRTLDPIVASCAPALIDETFLYRERRFPPKNRGCRCVVLKAEGGGGPV